MEFTVKVEETSKIQRKLTIQVAAKTVTGRYEKGLVEVQRTAKIKGFRPGMVPLSVVKQHYGADVRHQVFHDLIDDAYKAAIREHKIRAVSSPQIETPEHKTGEGAHDHDLPENKDLTFTATIDIMPDVEVKGYTGLALTQEKVDVKDTDVDATIKNLLESQAQMQTVSGGLAMADGSMSSRPVQKGDFVDMNFDGGVVTEKGVEKRQGMKGTRMLEVGSDSLIPGFEDHLIGMRRGDTKTFRVPFPADFYEKDLAGKESEFTVTINEVKEKKLPNLDDDFAKQMGYEGVADLKTKAKDHLTQERTRESERKLRSDLLAQLIEKNPFDCPASLIQAQTRVLAQDVAGNLKQQGFSDEMIQEALGGELESLQKRAENQVRASLLLEAIAKKEKVAVTTAEIDKEIESMAANSKVEVEKVRDYYEKNPARREDLEFRLREDRTLAFLLDKAKLKKA